MIPAALLAVLLAAPSEAPEPLTLEVGEAVALCGKAGVRCPAAGTCDDPRVATPDTGPEGLVFRGVAPGTTVCAVRGASGAGAARVYRVTVVARPR